MLKFKINKLYVALTKCDLFRGCQLQSKSLFQFGLVTSIRFVKRTSLLLLPNCWLVVVSTIAPFTPNTSHAHYRIIHYTLTIPYDYQLCNLVHKVLYNKEKLPPAYSNYFTQNYAVHNYCTKIGMICTYRAVKQLQVKKKI